MSRREESGSAAWLRRHKLSARSHSDKALLAQWQAALQGLSLECPEPESPVCATAVGELITGVSQLIGGTVFASPPQVKPRPLDQKAWDEGCEYRLDANTHGLSLSAASPRGLLYAVFALLEALALKKLPSSLLDRPAPGTPLRMLDHWDNFDGSIERGYAGQSLFFRHGRVAHKKADLARLDRYARLLASIGINAVVINNVNVHRAETELLEPPLLNDVERVAQIFRPWGIRLFLSVNYASPLQLGGLDTADPLDPRVQAFWNERAKAVWAAIPDFGGFLVKADSEGRPGPFTYGRTHADGANLLGRAVAPFGGLVLWRCFVYNCQQDWRDRSTDRARAAYDHFMPLDGQFLDNVILQIKNGPMDFQVREPVSPLLGGMNRTKQALELQITQEYTGQQRHVCCLLPAWQQVLDFDYRPGSRVAEAVAAVSAVANVGDEANWTGHHLAQVNLYGFGALAWNPQRPAHEIIQDWVGLSFDRDPSVFAALVPLLETSWEAYESYTAPLGVGWMVNPNHHYGPNVDGYEFSRWGTYHFADRDGIGVARSVASGTGFAGQYAPHWARTFESLELCPDELLLFFHHVPWSHRLKNGSTVIQDIYDTHFEGVEWCDRALALWCELETRLDARRYREVRERLEHQCAHAREWRDQINTYCFRKSGIKDEKNRLVYP